MLAAKVWAVLSVWTLFGGCAPSVDEAATRLGDPPAALVDSPTVLFLGDSLTEGLGVEPEQAYPARIETLVQAEGLGFEVVNAGLSGDTSAGGLARLDWLLRRPPSVLVLALGANDGLRGIEPTATEQNLLAIVDRARAVVGDVPIVLCGMQVPPNLGREYTEAFAGIYTRVAQQRSLSLVPFLLEGVGGERALNQSDGLHPNATGQQVLAENVWSVLAPLLRRLAEANSSTENDPQQR